MGMWCLLLWISSKYGHVGVELRHFRHLTHTFVQRDIHVIEVPVNKILTYSPKLAATSATSNYRSRAVDRERRGMCTGERRRELEEEEPGLPELFEGREVCS